MNINNELADFDAAGALAEELPWWGWLEDGRSCLTRAGELMSIARLTPSVLDGQTPEQLDRVVDRWQRMLSGVDSRTRLYFYLLRRPIQFEDQDEDKGSSVAALRVLTRFVLKYTLRAAHLELGGVDLDLAVEDDVLPLDRADMTQQVGVEREVRRGGKP